MRISAIIILFLVSTFFAVAQKTKPSAYYFTPTSEKYLSDAAVDSLFYNTSADLFKENMIPSALFEKKFPGIKSLLVMMSRNGITQSFKAVELKLKKPTEKDPQAFNENKRLFTTALEKQVRATFYSNRLLSQYLSFNNSDHISYFNSTVRVGKGGKLLVQEKQLL